MKEIRSIAHRNLRTPQKRKQNLQKKTDQATSSSLKTEPFDIAEIEIMYRPEFKITDRPVVDSTTSAYQIFLRHWNKNTIQIQEEMKMLLLNQGNHVLGLVNISTGGFDYTPVDVKFIFSMALKAGSSCIIIAHNHPSGNLRPSQMDISQTAKIVEAGALLDITVLDHLIITPEDYCSFRERGHIKTPVSE